MTLTATVADTSGSPSLWSVDITYDGGGTWSAMTTTATIGPNALASVTDLPALPGPGTAQLRVTNNTTAATATSAPFSLAADTIDAVFVSYASGVKANFKLVYASDGADAQIVSGDNSGTAAAMDTSSGTEGFSPDPDVGVNTWSGTVADPITSGGTCMVDSWGNWTFDRPFAVAPAPQNITTP